MSESQSASQQKQISRDRLAELLNEDLSREYQAIIAYVVYSQVLKGAEYMDTASICRTSCSRAQATAMVASSAAARA